MAGVPLFRVTKKLATALKLKLPKAAPAPPVEEHEWFADLFHVEGKKCVVWVHRTTLLTFVHPAVRAAELRAFHELFRHEFRAAHASMALPESLFDRCGVHTPEAYAPTNSRAIVGSMLDYRTMFEFMVEYEGGLQRADVQALNVELNQSPMSVLGMESAVVMAGGVHGYKLETQQRSFVATSSNIGLFEVQEQRAHFMAAVDEGLADSEAGRVYTQAGVVAELEKRRRAAEAADEIKSPHAAKPSRPVLS